MATPPTAARALPAEPARGRVRIGLLSQFALVAAALTVYLLVLAQSPAQHQDFDTYWGAARDAWQGNPLYGSFLRQPLVDPTLRPAYIYPPAFALVTAPLGALPLPAAAWAWLAISQAALTACLVFTIRRLRPAGWATVTLLCATFTFYPLWVEAVQGQANLVVLALVLAGVLGITGNRPGWAAAIGAAAAFKVVPLLLLVWLLAERRFREAAWLIGGFGGITLVAAILRPSDTLTYFRDVLPALAHGTAFYANQSVAGVLARFFSANVYTQPWVAVVALPAITVVLGGGLAALWWWRTRGLSLWLRSIAFLPLLPLLSSVTWTHHLVILLPLVWVALARLGDRRWPGGPTLTLAAALVAISVVPRWRIGPAFGEAGFRAAQTGEPTVVLAANALFLGTLLLFLAAPWLLRSR